MAKAIGNVALYIIAIIYGGFVFSLIWEWVIVSQFDILSISMMQGIGIKLLFTYLMFGIGYLIQEASEKKTEFSEAITVSLVSETMFLIVAYIFNLFI